MTFVIYGADALIALISNGLAGSRDGHEQWLWFYVPHTNCMY